MSKTKNKKRLVLLDSHAILHRAYHALPDFTSPNGEPTGALYGVVAMLLKTEYFVEIGSASGEEQAYHSKSIVKVTDIVRAINQAILEQG